MEGSESSINRVGRTIWTVWGYVTGAVGRFLSANKDNQDAAVEQKEAISNVTDNKSYRELKEDEEKEEKRETEAWSQREKPQSGVNVRTAAVQWEKTHSGDTSKRTCTGVVWNAAVQKEVLDKKAQKQRDTEETLDNNNKAAQTESNDVFEKPDPASTDADMGSPDFGFPRSFDTDAEDEGDENDANAVDKEDKNVIDDVVESEHADNEGEEIHKCAEQEEECDFGDEVNIRELTMEKVMEHTEDQDENEEDDEKERNQGMTRNEDEASTHMADDFSSQLPYSMKEREDLLNKEINVNNEYIEEIMEHEASTTQEREVADVRAEEAEQETVRMEKNEEERESKLNEAQTEYLKEMVETECKLLEELMASEEAERTSCSVESESSPTPERVAIEEKMEDTVGTVKHWQHEAGQQSSEFEGSKSSDELDVCESKLDGAHTDLPQGIVGTTCELLQEPMTRQMSNTEIYKKEPEPLCKGVEIKAELTPERSLINAVEETNQGTVGTVKDVEHEAGQVLSEYNVVGAVDVCDSKLDEKSMGESTENEAAERDAVDKEDENVIDDMVECEHADNEEVEIHKCAEQEEECDFGDEVNIRELTMEKVMEHTEDQDENEEDDEKERNQGMTRDEDEASTHIADDFSSQLPYSTKEREDLLNKEINVNDEYIEEIMEHQASTTPERKVVGVGAEEAEQETVRMEKNEEERESKLNEAQIEYLKEMVETECKLLEELMASEEAERTSCSVKSESSPTPERVAIEEKMEDTVETVKDGQHEAGQQSSEFEGSKSSDELDVCESKLDGAHTDLPQGIVGTTCELLQEPMTRQIENAEIYEKEPEPLCKGIEIKAELTPERSLINAVEETNQGTVGTVKDVEHEAGQVLSESNVVETFDVCDSKLDEKSMEETTENEAAEREDSDINSEEMKQDTVEMVQDGLHEASQQLNESKASETKLDESQIEFVERMVETECKLMEKLVGSQEAEHTSCSIENGSTPTPERVAIEAKIQDPVETVKDGQHEAGQQSSESEGSKSSDELDVCECKLDGAHTDLPQGIVGTTCEPLQEPMTRQIENAEIYEKVPEPLCKGIEIKANLTPERPIDGIEETNQGTVGTVKDVEHEAGQVLSEYNVVGAVNVCDSKLDEKSMEESTENEAPEREDSDINSEEMKQDTVEMVQDGLHEASQQLNESKASETMLDESQIELVEKVVETDCKLLEEIVTGQLENEETYKEEEEPISRSTEHKAAVTPERELIDTIEVTKPDTVGTAKDSQHEMGHQLGHSKGFENADKPDIQESNLVEAQNEHTDGRAATEYELSEEPVRGQMENAEIYEKDAELTSKGGLFGLASGNEAGDSDLTAVIMEADQVEHHEEETEAGNTPETEVELLDIIGSQLPEEVIKQDIEFVATGPGNQSGTSQTISNFSQEVRAEVAADDVKKSETAFFEIQRIASKSSSAEEVNEAAFCEAPSPSPQELNDTQDTTKISAEMVTEPTIDETKTSFTEQKMEVLETHSKLTAVSDHDMAEAKCALSTGPQTESELYLAAVEMLKQSSEAEAPVPDDRSESQIPLDCGEWTMQGGSGDETEPRGQIEHSGASDPPESETASEKLEMLRNPQKDAEDAELKEFKVFELKKHPEKEGERPDEAEIGMLDEIKAMTASLEDVEEIMSGLTQGSEERLEAGTIKTREEETAMEASESDSVDLQTHNDLLSNLVENKNNLQIETIDVDSEACGKTESMKEKFQNAPEEHEDHASIVDKGETAVDSNKSLQERSRSGLKRGSEKMARNAVAKPSVAKAWAALEQVSSLDCTVQKSKIAVKNRFTRPPKNPRTLINMISAEPSVAPRPSQPSVLKKGLGVGPSVLPPGVIGFKLPGLGGGGLPVLRKTDAGKKMRDDGDAQSVTTQKSDSQTDPKEDCGKKEPPASKPKWTPPRHPGMGNPMMMSELKSKLKKPGKD